MSEKEVAKYIEELREFMNDILGSKEKTKEFLVSTGIYDEKGDLAPQYAGE